MAIKKDHEEELAEPDCQMDVLAHCERSVSGFGGWAVPERSDWVIKVR